MQHIHSEDLESWCAGIDDLLKKHLPVQGRLFLPAGNTPVPIYERWERDKPSFLEDITFVQIDEVQGTQIFKEFFEQHLPSYLPQFEWIRSPDKSADTALLGLGHNGHVGFHEPGIPADFKGGEVKLMPETVKVLRLEGAERTKGVTYGLGSFLACGAIILAVRDPAKQPAIDKVLEKDETCPAAHLTSHPNAYLVTCYAH